MLLGALLAAGAWCGAMALCVVIPEWLRRWREPPNTRGKRCLKQKQ